MPVSQCFYEDGLSEVMYGIEPKSAYYIVNTQMFCFELFFLLVQSLLTCLPSRHIYYHGEIVIISEQQKYI